MTTREQAIATASACIAEAVLLLHTGTVAEAAARAYTPTGPSLAELEAGIAAIRAQTPAPRSQATLPAAAGSRATKRKAS